MLLKCSGVHSRKWLWSIVYTCCKFVDCRHRISTFIMEDVERSENCVVLNDFFKKVVEQCSTKPENCVNKFDFQGESGKLSSAMEVDPQYFPKTNVSCNQSDNVITCTITEDNSLDLPNKGKLQGESPSSKIIHGKSFSEIEVKNSIENSQEFAQNLNCSLEVDDVDKNERCCNLSNGKWDSYETYQKELNTEKHLPSIPSSAVKDTIGISSSCWICRSKSEENEEKVIQKPRTTSRGSNSSSNASGRSDKKQRKEEVELEFDPVILSRRQKQIDYGKNTIGYQRYTSMVPKPQRTRQHPQTPPKNVKYSRRAWDGLIKSWRRKLHDWDPNKTTDGSDEESFSLASSSSQLTLSDDLENSTDISTEKYCDMSIENKL